MGRAPQGWYWDPFRRHEDRYFSDGRPTKLVRDAGRESFDPPPDSPLPGLLVRARARPSGARGATDLRRADRTGADGYSSHSAGDVAISAMVRYGAAR